MSAQNMSFILNDPKVNAYNAARREVFYKRAKDALEEESISLEQHVLEELAEFGFRLEGGDVPSLAPLAEKGYRTLHDKVKSDAKAIKLALEKLIKTVDKCCVPTTMELVKKMQEKDITVERINEVLDALCAVVDDMATSKRKRRHTGRAQNSKSGFALLAWKILKVEKVKMRTASRIIAKIFDGNDKSKESIYQAIRNEGVR